MPSPMAQRTSAQLFDSVELMTYIIEHLDKPDLALLARVHPSLFASAIKYLYHHMDFVIPAPVFNFLPLMSLEENLEMWKELPPKAQAYRNRYLKYRSHVKTIDMDLGGSTSRPTSFAPDIPPTLNHKLFVEYPNLQTVRVTGWRLDVEGYYPSMKEKDHMWLQWSPGSPEWDIIIDRVQPGQPEVVIQYSKTFDYRPPNSPIPMPPNHAEWFNEHFPGAEHRLVGIEVEDLSEDEECNINRIDKLMPHINWLGLWVMEDRAPEIPIFPRILPHLPNLNTFIYGSTMREEELRAVGKFCKGVKKLAVIVRYQSAVEHPPTLDCFRALHLLSEDKFLPELEELSWEWEWKESVDWSDLLADTSPASPTPWGTPGSALPRLRLISFEIGGGTTEPPVDNAIAMCRKFLHPDIKIVWSLEHIIDDGTESELYHPDNRDQVEPREDEIERWTRWVERYNEKFAKWKESVKEAEKEGKDERDRERAAQPAGWKQLGE